MRKGARFFLIVESITRCQLYYFEPLYSSKMQSWFILLRGVLDFWSCDTVGKLIRQTTQKVNTH